MRDNELDANQISTFLVGVWPVIEQFPQYMAQNLLKLQYGRARGHDLARRYLIRNIRVEQNHADHWVEWAIAAASVSRSQVCQHQCDSACVSVGTSPYSSSSRLTPLAVAHSTQ
eukprot:TRINITY_DN6036_c0_g1_i5.p2 TRINITY_DN6036_c0_g1~~TRINITY_DN6036_c0_g1_i5.p2  ORF type:complete len:114 (+),score=32.35 TRINITY_DN6036_c0_g1_i5:214-555(+)